MGTGRRRPAPRLGDVLDHRDRVARLSVDAGRAVGWDSGASRVGWRGDEFMTYAKDPRVDAYIDALPDWQQAICHEVRDLVHGADPEVTETIKYTDRPYFVLKGNICALLAAKGHVNVFLYDGAIVPDPEGIITSGHD